MKFEEIIVSNQTEDQEMFCMEVPLAMAYVPMQKLGAMYSEQEALRAGTLFPALDFPWKAKGVK